jgi:hypothetical protein
LSPLNQLNKSKRLVYETPSQEDLLDAAIAEVNIEKVSAKNKNDNHDHATRSKKQKIQDQ